MNRSWKQSLMTIPGVGVLLLPKLACPLCWPAYAGLLSSVGLGFLISVRYLLPITATFLALAVGVLAFRAPRRRGYGPFVLGLFAAAGVLVGKFWWESNPMMYGGGWIIGNRINVGTCGLLAWLYRIAVAKNKSAKGANDGKEN
jgi:hypothetical protein